MQHTPVMSLVWQIAAIETADSHFEFIEPEHFFVALCKLEGFSNVTRLRGLGVPESQVSGVEAEIDLLMGLFQRYNVGAATFRHELRQKLGNGGFHPAENADDIVLHRSDTSRRVFEHALKIAKKRNANQLAVFHLLAGLLADSGSPLVKWLHTRGVNTVGLRQSAETTVLVAEAAHIQPTSPLPTLSPSTTPLETTSLPETYLSQFSIDITDHARQLGSPPGVMPEKTLLAILDILRRNVRNNPLILSKQPEIARQLMYHLAWHFLHNPDYAEWKSQRIIQPDVTKLAAHITYQGEFADRFQKLLDEVSGQPGVLLFIDRIETIIGSGTIHVDMDDVIATLVKVLAGGAVQCVGATDPSEYQRYIRRSETLARLFTPHRIKTTIPIANIPERTAFNSGRIHASSSLRPAPNPPRQPTMISDEAKTSRGTPLVDHLLQILRGHLQRFGITLEVSATVQNTLAQLAADGAASSKLRQTFISQIENPLGGMILRGEVDYGQTVRVEVEQKRFVLHRTGG